MLRNRSIVKMGLNIKYAAYSLPWYDGPSPRAKRCYVTVVS